MKRIKTTFAEFINEAVIRPYDFDSSFQELKNLQGKIKSLEQINNIFKDVDVYFCDLDEFKSLDWTDEEKELIPTKTTMMGGMKFGVYNPKLNKMSIVVEPDRFINYLNNGYDKTEFHNLIKEILRHESIHKQQVQRMTGGEKGLRDAPKDPEEYFSNKNEIMAYAQSFVDQMKQSGKTNDQILNMMRNNKVVGSWVYNQYSRVVDEKTFKRFQKYVYLYLQDD